LWKKYGKYPILKISKIPDIFELDIYHRYISPVYIVPTLGGGGGGVVVVVGTRSCSSGSKSVVNIFIRQIRQRDRQKTDYMTIYVM